MRIRAILVAAIGAAALALSAPALASTSGRTGAKAVGFPGAAEGPSVAGPESDKFAGWQANVIGNAVSLTSTFVVPRLKCAKAEQAIAPSVGAFTSTVSESSFTSANLFIGCYEGKAHYFPSLTVNGVNRNYRQSPATPGDTIVLSISETATGTSVTVLDKTTKRKTVRTGAGSNMLPAPWIGDAGWYTPSDVLQRVPDFGKVHYSRSLMLGMPIGSWPGSEWDRYKKSTLQIHTSPLASDRESFTTVFRNS